MPDRRTVIAGAGLGIAVPLSLRAEDTQVPGLADAVVSQMLALITDLPAVASGRFTASAVVAAILAKGGRIGGAIAPGRFLATRDPLRLYARIPMVSPTGPFDLALTAHFVEAPSGTLALMDADECPIDPFASIAAASAVGPSMLGPAWQAQYDRLADGPGGVLALPAGLLSVNLILHSRRVHVVGAGRGATILQPADPTRAVLSAEYREGSWGYVTIANLDLDGAGSGAIGFSAGSPRYVAGDEFSGRTRFENVGIANFRRAIVRTAGQIGLILQSCSFGRAETHLLSRGSAGTPGEPMHAGILTARDCHFQGARVSVARFESAVAGTGGVVFDNCIMERNPGIVFDIDGFANADMTTDFLVRDCWNEDNGTKAGAGGPGVPYASIRNAGLVRFEGTPLGPLSIRNSAVETYACPLDALTSVDADSDSTLRHHEARGYGSMVPVGLALSVAAAWQSDPPGRALTFEVPDRDYSIWPEGGRLLTSSRADTPETWLGSHSVETIPVPARLGAGRQGQRLALSPGARLFPSPVAVPADSWLVWAMTYRLDSGAPPTMQVTGDRGISTARSADSQTWQTVGGMAKVALGTLSTSIWFVQGAEAGVVDLAGYCLAVFARRQDAVSFLNAGAPTLRLS